MLIDMVNLYGFFFKKEQAQAICEKAFRDWLKKSTVTGVCIIFIEFIKNRIDLCALLFYFMKIDRHRFIRIAFS